PEGDTIKQVRISRCLLYVSEVLGKVVANGGCVGRRPSVQKMPFSVTQEDILRVEVSAEAIPISEIVRRINAVIDQDTMARLKTTTVLTYLVQTGFLEQIVKENGRSSRRPTQAGLGLGIFTEVRSGQYGIYRAVLYKTAAQQFLLDNIDALTALNNQKTTSKNDEGTV
ncbi:MAG: hypothetical protein IKQ87_12125, partial [Clostridia bacterium]|nr:hypothetical protein [Clostridia bacterium]